MGAYRKDKADKTLSNLVPHRMKGQNFARFIKNDVQKLGDRTMRLKLADAN